MKRLMLLFSILLVTACAHGPEHPLPAPPQFSTISGQRCAIECRQKDYDCKMACQGTKSEQIACVSECNKELGKCYGLCIELFE